MNDRQAELDQLRKYADPLNLPYAWGGPFGAGVIRSTASDFMVTEQLSFQPSGSGEHLLVQLRKTGQNTRWVAKQLAVIAGVPYRSVSYAGLKDRHAVTEQWFGLHLAGQPDPDFSAGLPDGVECLEMVRHDKKLRQGQLILNHFHLLVRSVSKTSSLTDSHDEGHNNSSELENTLATISAHGVPNYFGPQRFGRGLANLQLLSGSKRARDLNRETRSFALSALRAALFNGYLAERVRAENWAAPIAGEIIVSGKPRAADESGRDHPNQPRYPSGILWGGRGQPAIAAEQAFFDRFPLLTRLLEDAGARASRRSLVTLPEDLRWEFRDDTLQLDFSLGPGAFATTLVRELITTRDAALAEV